MRRLYLHIYLTFLGILVLFVGLVSIPSLLSPTDSQERRVLVDGLGAVLGEWLPGPDRPLDELQAAVERLGQLLPVHLTVREADGTLLAAVGEPLPAAPPGWTPAGGRMRSHVAGPTVALSLPDGRRVVVHWLRPRRPFGVLVAVGLLAVAIGVGAYPVVRRLTRRLERLHARVEALGAGDLTARVEVEGRDEVANLARSFNHAADRIERLVNAQRTMLAGASHELRSPLARMRMAIELLAGADRPELRARLSQDIAELDALIGELLLASRLDALEQLERPEDVDLLALLAEEGARTGAEVSGEAVCLQGDARLLRRLMRNLLENAQRYAAGSPVEASVVPLPPTGACLRVADRGPGVPEAERERIFEPFYRPTGLRERGDGGVGLGLALVRQIARHHGGEVRCVPRAGGGTCFEVDLRTGQPEGIGFGGARGTAPSDARDSPGAHRGAGGVPRTARRT
jgi:signal transduction histidine kinase